MYNFLVSHARKIEIETNMDNLLDEVHEKLNKSKRLKLWRYHPIYRFHLQEAVCQTESSDSSESLLSGSPAFVPDSGTSGFVAGVGKGLLLALPAFASPSFSCSAASTCKSFCQGMFNL